MSAVDPPDGSLVLVGTPIGNLGDLAPRALRALRDADVIACEDTRRTRALLSAVEVPAGSRLRSVHAHNEQERAARIVEEVAAGRLVAYVTDAGMPGISDPGAELVRACLRAGLPVDVVPGPTHSCSRVSPPSGSCSRGSFRARVPIVGPDSAGWRRNRAPP